MPLKYPSIFKTCDIYLIATNDLRMQKQRITLHPCDAHSSLAFRVQSCNPVFIISETLPPQQPFPFCSLQLCPPPGHQGSCFLSLWSCPSQTSHKVRGLSCLVPFPFSRCHCFSPWCNHILLGEQAHTTVVVSMQLPAGGWCPCSGCYA